jgi:hypothetical protein
MPTCDSCGNEYDKPLEITKDGESYTFDSFECAIHKLAPRCEHCGVTIVGHGLEATDGRFFCCAHCAKHAGVENLADRV